MAIEQKDKRKVREEDAEEGEENSEASAEESQPLARVDSADEGSDASSEDSEDGEDDEEAAAAQLGMDRYIIAGFFGLAMLVAYVLARTIHGIWATVSNKDWFNQTVPKLAAYDDDTKTTISFVVAGAITLFIAIRNFRKPEVRTWCEEVASELTKVKWPTRKDVQNSTFIVIVASAMATLYLALLDRLWAFVTSIVYGDGT